MLCVGLKPWSERGSNESADAILGRINGALYGMPEALSFGFNFPEIPGLGTTSGLELNLQARAGQDINTFNTQVARTHPELVVNGAARPSPSYLDPAVFNAECDQPLLPDLPPPVLWVRFDGVGQLARLPVLVISHASRAGAAALDVTQLSCPS